MKILASITAGIIILSTLQMNSQSDKAPMRNKKPSLYYLVHEPVVKSAKPPLLILLHGLGSNEKDLFSLVDYLDARLLIVAARAPITIAEGSYQWYTVDFSTGKPVVNAQQAESSRLMLLQFINELKEKYNADERRVFIGGFSQGAIMSFSVGLTNPDKIRGIVAMSGRILEEIKPIVANKSEFKHLNAFVSHGTDDPVLPVSFARSAKDFLEKLTIQTEYKEYRAAHQITEQNLLDLNTWLKAMLAD